VLRLLEMICQTSSVMMRTNIPVAPRES
jgi:hypothetical protein